MKLIDEFVYIIPAVLAFIVWSITKDERIISMGLIVTGFLFFMHKSAVAGWYKAREDGEFCKSCGAATYITKIRTGYDPKTGVPIKEDYRDCPNTRYGYEVDDHPRSYDF